MKLYLIPAIISVLCWYSCTHETPVSPFSTPGNQVVQVLADHVDSTTASMYLWERSDSTAEWKCVDTFPVRIGRNGLAPGNDLPGRKLEGDGNAPEGLFLLSKVFSYHLLTDLHMPFEQVDSSDLCVDDVHSQYYNMLIDDDTTQLKDYSSFERMQIDRQARQLEPWCSKLRLESEAGRRPLRRCPHHHQNDGEDGTNLPPKDSASAHTGSSRQKKTEPIRE